VRYEQLSAVASTFLEHAVANRGALPELEIAPAAAPHVFVTGPPAPPYLKASATAPARPKPFPTAITMDGIVDGRRPTAATGAPVPSRRRSGATSPSVDITPGVRRVTTGGHRAALLHLELYEEATLHQAALLAQLTTGERVLRSIAELNHLRARVARDLAQVPTATRLHDREWWTKLTVKLLRSPHLHVELRALLGRYEEVCGALIDAKPGDELGDEHDIAQVHEVLKEEAPVVATWLQMGWLLKATEGDGRGRGAQPLGYLRRDQRPTRASRARSTSRKGVQGRPTRVVRFADHAEADVAMAAQATGGEEDEGQEEEGEEGTDEVEPPFVPTNFRRIERVDTLLAAAAIAEMDDTPTQPTQPVPPTQPVQPVPVTGNLGLLAGIARGVAVSGAPAAAADTTPPSPMPPMPSYSSILLSPGAQRTGTFWFSHSTRARAAAW